jgi:hypothetical protein
VLPSRSGRCSCTAPAGWLPARRTQPAGDGPLPWRAGSGGAPAAQDVARRAQTMPLRAVCGSLAVLGSSYSWSGTDTTGRQLRRTAVSSPCSWGPRPGRPCETTAECHRPLAHLGRHAVAGRSGRRPGQDRQRFEPRIGTSHHAIVRYLTHDLGRCAEHPLTLAGQARDLDVVSAREALADLWEGTCIRARNAACGEPPRSPRCANAHGTRACASSCHRPDHHRAGADWGVDRGRVTGQRPWDAQVRAQRRPRAPVDCHNLRWGEQPVSRRALRPRRASYG